MQFELIEVKRTPKYVTAALPILSRAFFWLWVPIAFMIVMLARGGLERTLRQLGFDPIVNRDFMGFARLIAWVMLWAGLIGYCIVLVFITFVLLVLLPSGLAALL